MRRSRPSKTVAIVAPHFVPSNLAGVHRARLWSLHLREFGWEPLIVTTHWKFYEEAPEFPLMELLPPDLEVIQTKALPTRPIRLVGDVGIRAFWWHLQALRRLCSERRINFVHITIPSFYSACLGRMLHAEFGMPYGIDYIDPWVHDAPGSDVPFTKAWGTRQLARLLEPWAVKKASLITGISPAYYQGTLERNPRVSERAVCAAMPYGGAEADHQFVRAQARAAFLFVNHPNKFNLIYAGAMLPRGYSILKRLLEGLALLRGERPGLDNEFHLHFVGTGKSPTDAQGFNVRPFIEQFGLRQCASEHPQRLGYLDVLTHLAAASGVLVIGSTEAHYSPSKIYQAIMSRHPVFALLHEKSPAAVALERARAGVTLRFDSDQLPTPPSIKSALEQFIFANEYREDRVDWRVVEEHSARSSARALAAAIDEALAKTGISPP